MEQKDTVDYKKLYEETLLKLNRQLSTFAELKAINETLSHQLNLLIRSTYGSKSERFSSAQQSRIEP